VSAEKKAHHAKWKREWRRANPDRAKAPVTAWRLRNKDKVAAHKRKAKYGLDDETYTRMLEMQAGKCAICDAPQEKQRYGKLHVDHCHSSGEVRGLLCAACNTSLGLFRDSPRFLRLAASYLEHFSE
jgi:hypothetical protein